jgi:hypothetical protein
MLSIKHSFNKMISQLDQRYVRLLLVIITIVLFVLGAGAPGDGGGVGIDSVFPFTG